MPEKQTYQQGEFCWTELATTDPDSAKSFYTGLFGWTTRENPIEGSDTVYTTFEKDGKSVAACVQQQPQELEQGIPPHWNTYITVNDVDEITTRSEELGAKVIAPPFDVMELGRMAVVTDPTGAIISFWQDAQMGGAQVINETGARVWNELMTYDVDGAIAFYTGLFGYETETMDSPSGPYTILKLGDTQWAGIMSPGQEGLPQVWNVYYGTDDIDAVVAKARELGGTTPLEPFDVPEVGRIGWITDPTGATFGLLQTQI